MAARRRTWLWLGAAVLVVAAAVTLVWFQPQKLLYDDRVDEALPSVTAVELASGTFISREHPTTGTARVLRLPDGQQVLRLEGFETSNGPVLLVYLSASPAQGEDGLFDDDYIDLGPLKGNIGDQNYAVPAEVDPTDWASVVIWCERFSVSFGAADLVTADNG